MRPRLLRLRIKTERNSAGMSLGSSVGVGDVVAVVGVGSGAGSGAGGGDCKNVGILIFGVGIVIRGFLVRIISVIVAIYKGNAASNIIPKTNPGKPRNCARIR